MKQPVPGQVKTRLGAEIGLHAAAQLAEAFQTDLLQRTAGVADRRIVAYAPAGSAARSYYQKWDRRIKSLWPQPDLPLGERLAAFFERWCEDGQPVVVIGTDSPTLPRSFLRQAFEQLQTCDCVLGPAIDGGYYLVGLKEPAPGLFAGIDWSSPHVFRQTVERLQAGHQSLSLLPPWYDIDTRADVQFLQGHLQGLLLAGELDEIPQHTLRAVQQLSLERFRPGESAAATGFPAG